MKTIIVFTLIFALQSTRLAFACTVCKSQQPKVLQGITHGVGPESVWDYSIIVSSCLLVLITLIMSLRYLIKPKEGSPNHIKYMILEEK
jgi:uncharacterized protein YybS (DUF2232 family)